MSSTSVPPFRDFPPGRMADRKQHLLAEIGREQSPRTDLSRLRRRGVPTQRPRRRRLVVLLAVAAILGTLAVAPAFGVGDALLHLFGRSEVPFAGAPPQRRSSSASSRTCPRERRKAWILVSRPVRHVLREPSTSAQRSGASGSRQPRQAASVTSSRASPEAAARREQKRSSSTAASSPAPAPQRQHSTPSPAGSTSRRQHNSASASKTAAHRASFRLRLSADRRRILRLSTVPGRGASRASPRRHRRSRLIGSRNRTRHDRLGARGAKAGATPGHRRKEVNLSATVDHASRAPFSRGGHRES